jgi:signal transduction histidine kinase
VLFTPDDRAAGVPEAEQQRARDEGRAELEGWHQRKDGTRVWCSSVMRPLQDGQLLGFAKIAQDLTRRRRAAADLREAHDHLEERVRTRTSDLESDVRGHQLSEERTRRLLLHVVTAQEDERRRIARDLHDQLGQQLTALRLALDGLADRDGGGFDDRLRFVRDTAQRLDGEVDFLARELRPASLDELGLAVALEQYVAEWSRHYGIEATCHAHPLELDSELEVALYRIAQEALNNVVKHAHASRVEVLIEARADDLVLIIEDDGVGFKPEEVAGRGLGLLGISERASIVQGSVEIESSPGQGATLFVRVPLHTTGGHAAGGDTTEESS